MKLHGPAHPENLRVKVGRWGDRHYRDPLPANAIAPATDAVWPSVTTIKKAAGKDWSWTSLERAATYLETRRGELDGMNAKEIHARLNEVNKAGLTRAGDRGSSIHALIEARAEGRDEPVIPDAVPYIPAVDAFLNDCQPEWLLSEVAIYNRAVGYGGTVDAGIAIKVLGGTFMVDWKTRRSADKHAAYDEECWQVAAYLGGEYMIVDRDGQAVRERLPHFDGGLIVSLAPEGYRLYPIEFEPSWSTFQELAAFSAGKNGRTFSGRFLHVPAAAPAIADPALVDKLRAEVLWIKEMSPAGMAVLAADWPDGVPTFTKGGPTSADQTALLAMLVERVKRDCNVPFNPADNPIAPPAVAPVPPVELKAVPDEGGVVDLDICDDLAAQLKALPEPEQAWIGYIAKQAVDSGASISVRQKASTRRYLIARGLVLMAPHGEDELLRALVALAVNDDSLTSPAIPAGAVVASLGAVEAAAFAALCEQYAAGGLPTVVGQDNRLRVQRAA